MVSFGGCSEADFSDKYLDPSKVTTTSVDKLFTGVLEKAVDILMIAYGRYMIHDQDVGAICQTWGCRTDASLYENDLYMYESWGRYIGVCTQFKVLQSEYEKLPDAEKADKKGYLLAGNVVLYHAMLQALDEVGKLPFSEVGGYLATGEMTYASLDDTKALYETILDDLGRISQELSAGGVSISPSTDWLNKGNMAKWQIHANSLRLRCAMRLSGAEDYTNPENTLKDKAVSVVKEIFGNGAPIVTNESTQIVTEWGGSGNGWWTTITGFDQYIGSWHHRRTASKAMMDRLDLDGSQSITEGDDPRLGLFFDPITGGNNEGKYIGIDPRDETSKILANLNEPYQYSAANERSFRECKGINTYVITPSEIAFYKAEAILRFGVAGDAKAEFVRGIRESVNMYYTINSFPDATTAEVEKRSPVTFDPAKWTTGAVNEFASALWDKAGGNKTAQLKLIYEQFWMHNWVFNTIESWSSLRRTGIPELYYPYISSAPTVKVVPQRFIVPLDEHRRNENIPDETVNAYTPGKSWWEVIFWARLIQGETQ
jgi:hypothetical protein